MNRTRQRNAILSRWQILLLLLAVLASGVQQLVAQTHWHTSAVASSSVSAPSDEGAGQHRDCLWCQIAAHASAAAPPAFIELLVAPDEFAIHDSPNLHAVAIPQPAHAWQSRGPPAV